MAAEARSFHALEIEKLERELLEAYQRRDIAGLDRILDDEYIFIAPNGQIRSKQAMRSFNWPRYERLEVDDIRVRLYGEAAVLTAQVGIHGSSPSNSVTGVYRNTRVYVRQRGKWRAVSGQSTRVE